MEQIASGVLVPLTRRLLQASKPALRWPQFLSKTGPSPPCFGNYVDVGESMWRQSSGA